LNPKAFARYIRGAKKTKYILVRVYIFILPN
jgi:hypothetical protein